MKSAQLKALRRGFTLVELLAVIVIIGILASMALYAASVAWVAAKNGSIAMDIKQLETDLQSYYSKFQSYPPDLVIPPSASQAFLNTRQQAIRSHLTKLAPRYTQGMPLLPDTPLVAGVDPQQARLNLAAEALVFFLGGYSKPASVVGSSKLLGFRADPANPFVQNATQLNSPNGWKKGTVGFDETRLVDLDGDGWYEYLPRYCNIPYAYFNAKTYMNPSLASAPRCEWPGTLGGVAVPYFSDNTQEKFMNAKTFQIIAAGQDSIFSSGEPNIKRMFPSGAGYTTEDNDNLTNFAERTLKDSMP